MIRRLAQIIFLFIALTMSACSATQIDIQMRAADAIGISANKAEKLWIQAFRDEMRRAADAASPTDVTLRLAAVHAVEARWQPVNAAWESARAAHDAYSGCLEAAHIADGGACPDSAALQHALEESIYAFRCALRAVGHPELDPLGREMACSAVASSAPGEQ